MFSRRRVALVSLAALSALSTMTPAFAQFKDADGNIHFQTGLSPSQKVEYSAGELSRKITANYCGLVIVPVPTGASMPASITVDGTSVDTATLPTQSVPQCVNNTLKEVRSVNFKDSTGRVIIVGKTAGVQSTVAYPGVPSLKSITANACGYARISNSTSNPAPATFTYGGQSYTTATLPEQIPNRCIDGKKFVYTP
jgi:hypothetical protein